MFEMITEHDQENSLQQPYSSLWTSRRWPISHRRYSLENVHIFCPIFYLLLYWTIVHFQNVHQRWMEWTGLLAPPQIGRVDTTALMIMYYVMDSSIAQQVKMKIGTPVCFTKRWVVFCLHMNLWLTHVINHKKVAQLIQL